MTTVYERAPLALGMGVVALVMGFAGPSCIDARCTQDRECPIGQLCELATGVCETPECTRNEECGDGQVCNTAHHCVAGCRGDEDCPAEHACVSQRCVPTGSSCECALAPTFCAQDLNPRSATSGQLVCSGDLPATVFVFGNVGCSHCKALLDEVLALGGELGGSPPVGFVQLKEIPVNATVVGGQFAGYTVPVYPDDDTQDIWGGFAATWYHVVLIDDHGCLAGHWGPLSGSDVAGATGTEIGAAWSNALSGACPVSGE